MARYYDLDKLKELIEARADTLIEGKEAFLDVAKWLDLLPPADDVPKSEYEKLKKKLVKTEVELINVCLEKTNCDEMTGYILAFYARQKLQEIFDEIEFEIQQLDYDSSETKAIAIEGIILNTKKKYIKSGGDTILDDLKVFLEGDMT